MSGPSLGPKVTIIIIRFIHWLELSLLTKNHCSVFSSGVFLVVEPQSPSTKLFSEGPPPGTLGGGWAGGEDPW